MPHKVIDSYPSSTASAQDGKSVKVHNSSRDSKGFNLRRTTTKGLDLQKVSQGSRTQPRKPHLRREEAFRLGRWPMEIDGDRASWRLEAKRIEALFGSTKAKAGEYKNTRHNLSAGDSADDFFSSTARSSRDGEEVRRNQQTKEPYLYTAPS
ncbi:hypothetical protein AJ78_05283 [Emergomyces pasteurianus Ep9510]|uniref:Uncharacterized protein n=1 Tax=Emergomyces pasteurianus Ep9510 TaxID=1447872 RepID=A0A1J9PEG6_9EURO|nr:hypothetical protein AJ78_05283 [Emergomyces pasteurianus Ep9510]